MRQSVPTQLPSVGITEARNAEDQFAVSVSAEWHVEIDKSVAENDIGEKGLSCLDGVCSDPSSAWRPNDAVF
jgi:hypothetical protein